MDDSWRQLFPRKPSVYVALKGFFVCVAVLNMKRQDVPTLGQAESASDPTKGLQHVTAMHRATVIEELGRREVSTPPSPEC